MKNRISALVVSLFLIISCVNPALAASSAQQQYENAQSLLSEKKYDEAKEIFSGLGAYLDAQKYVMYIEALKESDNGLYTLAAVNFSALGMFLDSDLRLKYCSALNYEEDEEFEKARDIYVTMPAFLDSFARFSAIPEKINAREYAKADRYESQSCLEDALKIFLSLDDYRDKLNVSDKDFDLSEYAKSKWKYTDESYYWWLRSTRDNGSTALALTPNAIGYSPNKLIRQLAVRPVLWVSVDDFSDALKSE